MKNFEHTQESVEKWVKDAVADGWSIEPSYTSEPQERACHLRKDGWVASAICRPTPPEWWRDPMKSNYIPQYSIAVWGPDRLCVEPPEVYSMEHLTKMLRYCHNCNSHDVETQRYSFAGRCCAKCRPGLAMIHEKPGWCD